MSTLSLPVSTRDHIRGNLNAPVTLLEYGDYECPYCGQAYPIVKSILKDMGDDLRFVFRNFPLTQIHPHAYSAAMAAEAADYQGRFWEMHDTLFENQHSLELDNLIDYAGMIGLDIEKFVNDMGKPDIEQRIHEDFISGLRSGVNGTPTFFINGERHNDSYDHETLLSALEDALVRKVP